MHLHDCLGKGLYFGHSAQIRKMAADAGIVAKTDCTVLILGETGTGKSVLARRIHDCGPRGGGSFVEVNCSGLRGELLKSELFGHARGSFTGAACDRAGLVEAADGGTLFLDEIGDMALDVQSLMLKVIEEKAFRRIGENAQRRSDFRLICATNRNLGEALSDGAFREDLFHRINTFPITIPPLRARIEDIHGMLKYLLKTFGYAAAPLDRETEKMLKHHPWPGNIRQLRNAIERALIVAQGEALAPEHFAGALSQENMPTVPTATEGGDVYAATIDSWKLCDVERMHIIRALKHFGGNKFKAGEALGISLSTIYRRLDKMWSEEEEESICSA